MMRRLKPKSSSALHCGFVRNLKEMTQLNWDYPNRFKKINKQAKMGEPERELTSKSAQAEVSNMYGQSTSSQNHSGKAQARTGKARKRFGIPSTKSYTNVLTKTLTLSLTSIESAIVVLV
ncbi:hypothetical protein YQE_11154, partial [Dendroctonus ponderosae]